MLWNQCQKCDNCGKHKRWIWEGQVCDVSDVVVLEYPNKSWFKSYDKRDDEIIDTWTNNEEMGYSWPEDKASDEIPQ